MSFSCHSKFVVRFPLFRAMGLFAVATTFAILASSSGQAQQQDFEELPLAEKYQLIPQEEIDSDPENRRELSQRNRAARTAARNELKAIQAILLSGGNIESATTQEYFQGYVFPSMTLEENLKEAGKLRYNFDRAYLGTKYVGASRRPLIENIILPGLQELVDNERLSPSARVNAVVLMSRLDDSPLVRSTKTAPRPSMAAFDSLAAIWAGDYPEFVKVSAFSGILRHVEVDAAVNSPRIPNDRKDSLMRSVTAMLDSITAEDPELKEDLNRWKYSKSCKLMSQIGLASETQNYFDRLAATIAKDNKSSKWVKLEAIRALQRLPLENIGAEKINALIETSLNFASQSLSEEAKLIKANVEELVYDNILWENVDLEVTGTNYENSSNAPVGGANTRGGAGAGMMSGGGGLSGGMGMGLSGGLDSGGGGSGNKNMSGGGSGDKNMGGSGNKNMGSGNKNMGSGSKNMEMMGPPKPIVELPNYELNLTRRRMKLVVFTVQELLELKAVKETATDRHKTGLTALGLRMDEFMQEDSNIGVVNLDKKDESEVQIESYTSQLQEACETMSTDLLNSVAKMRGEKIAPKAMKDKPQKGLSSPFGIPGGK